MDPAVLDSQAVVVLLAADSPERVAALLGSPPLAGSPVVVAPYGEAAERVAAVARALGAFAVVEAASDRWRALASAWAAAPIRNDVLLLAQEAVLAPGWAEAARGAFTPSGLATGAGASPYRGLPISIVAPVSEQASSTDQRISLSADDVRLGVDGYAHNRRATFGAIVSPLAVPAPLAVFVGGAARPILGLRPECGPWMFADLVELGRRLGIGSAVAEGWYVGSTAPASTRPERPADPGRAWYERSPGGARVWGVVRVVFRALRDLTLLRATLARLGPSVDGIALVAASNPLEIQSDPGWRKALSTSGALDAIDRELLQRCDGADESRVLDALRTWARVVSRADRVVAGIWSRAAGEAREREFGLGLVTAAEPTAEREGRLWCLRVEPGELVEQTGSDPASTRSFLHRICAHPSPSVSAYDVALLTLWDGPRSVREDAPWGDGGTWKGGPSEPRLFRVGASTSIPSSAKDPAVAPEATRVANLRLYDARLIREIDRGALLGLRRGDEAVRLARASTATRIGLHVLCYEREAPEDLARWLDELHGLIDLSVLVWTGGDRVSDDVIDLAERAGARLVRHPLNDDLAKARNTGIETIAANGCAWALFVDPDEWLTDPRTDAIAIRRMAESDRAGWLFQVANYVPAGEPTISDSIRMSSTRPEMRMSGRVHEGFGAGIKAIQARGEHPRLAYARFVLQHRGMALGAERTAEKLAKYEALLRLELSENPENTGAWVSLAWHLDNDGHRELAEEAYRRALACAGTAYLPFREVAVQRLREARVAMRECVERLTPDHQYARHANELLRLLDRYAPDAVVMPSHRTPPEPLPPFPGRVTSAGYDPGGEGA